MRKMKLVVAHAKCSKCGFERKLYFTSGYMYGERVVSTKSGKYCAYINLLNENIVQELEVYCVECFTEKQSNVSKSKLGRIISNIYGITCDDIFGEKIDTMPNTKCVNCGNGTMVENKECGERLEEVDVLEVTHDFWKDLDKDDKRNEVKCIIVKPVDTIIRKTFWKQRLSLIPEELFFFVRC